MTSKWVSRAFRISRYRSALAIVCNNPQTRIQPGPMVITPIGKKRMNWEKRTEWSSKTAQTIGWWWRHTQISMKRLAVWFPAVKSPLYLTKNLPGGQLPLMLSRWHVSLLSHKNNKKPTILDVKHTILILRYCNSQTNSNSPNWANKPQLEWTGNQLYSPGGVVPYMHGQFGWKISHFVRCRNMW